MVRSGLTQSQSQHPLNPRYSAPRARRGDMHTSDRPTVIPRDILRLADSAKSVRQRGLDLRVFCVPSADCRHCEASGGRWISTP